MREKTNKSSILNHGWVKVSVFLLSMIFLLTVINMTPITLADAPDGDEKFTIAIIPDTQWETSDPPKIEGEWFKNRTQWLAANKDDLDLRFVLHTGDVTIGQDLMQTSWLLHPKQ